MHGNGESHGDPASTYDLTTFTVRCVSVLHPLWKPVETERLQTNVLISDKVNSTFATSKLEVNNTLARVNRKFLTSG